MLLRETLAVFVLPALMSLSTFQPRIGRSLLPLRHLRHSRDRDDAYDEGRAATREREQKSVARARVAERARDSKDARPEKRRGSGLDVWLDVAMGLVDEEGATHDELEVADEVVDLEVAVTSSSSAVAREDLDAALRVHRVVHRPALVRKQRRGHRAVEVDRPYDTHTELSHSRRARLSRRARPTTDHRARAPDAPGSSKNLPFSIGIRARTPRPCTTPWLETYAAFDF